ncbi:MAG: hypothetical protein AAF085_09090 [Planctomycetota bacterium]
MQNQRCMTGVVLLLLCSLTGGAAAQFGPGPDPKEIERQRQYFIDKREAIGDTAFRAYAIATLTTLLDIHHPRHPRFEALSQQRGTPEYILRTEPGFYQNVVPMLVEMKAEEAMPVLAEHIKVFKHRWRHRADSNGRLGSGMDQQYALVANAWFKLAVDYDLGMEDAVEEYAELTSIPSALWKQVSYLMREYKRQDDAFEGWQYLEVSVEDPDSLFMRLATLPTGFLEAGTAIGLIDDIAKQRAWSFGRNDMKQILTHEDMRVRVALATVAYRQADMTTSEMKQPFRDELFRLEPASAKWFREELNAADLARFQLAMVWKQLLWQREDLNQQIPDRDAPDFANQREEYREAIKQNDDLLRHLYKLAAFDELDPVLLDLCIDSVGYTDAFVWVTRNQLRGKIALTENQIIRAASWINNPFAPKDHRERIIRELVKIKADGAADEIAFFYQQEGLLDGVNPTPKLHINSFGVPGYLEVRQDVLDFLQEQGRQERP